MTIKEIATESGLSEATVRRDIRHGHLKVAHVGKGSPPYDYVVGRGYILDWLFDRKERVGGLTPESKRWFVRLFDMQVTTYPATS
jgi:hypothetical protein